MAQPAYIFVVDPYQAEHISQIRHIFQGHKVFLHNGRINTLTELLPMIRKIHMSKQFTVKGILLSYTPILKKLISDTFSAPQKLGKAEAISTNYRGALFHKKIGKEEYPIVVFPELKSFFSVVRIENIILTFRCRRETWIM